MNPTSGDEISGDATDGDPENPSDEHQEKCPDEFRHHPEDTGRHTFHRLHELTTQEIKHKN